MKHGHIAASFGLALFCSVSSISLAADTRYVSDQLEITLRTGQSTKHSIVRMLKSGTPVTVIEVDAENDYAHVRTQEGTEGWVLTRYLMNTASARDRLASAQQRLASIESENKQLKERLAKLGEQQKEVTQQHQDAASSARQLQQELTQIRNTAANALTLDSENKTLKEQHVQLRTELQLVQQENATLKDRSDQDWFMKGAGVVIGGILLGLILPRLKLRKKSSWDSL